MNSPYTTGQMMFPVAGSVSGAPQDQYSRNYPPQVGMTRPLNAPPSDQMYFEPNTNRLYIPRAGFIPAMRAVSTSGADQQQRRPRGIEAPAAAAKLSSEQVSELKKQLLPELRRELAAQLEMEVEQKEAVLESKWFGLPPNTYGAGIWAVLVLEVEATGLDLLVRGRQSEDVPMNQRWEKSAKLWFIDDPYQWFTKRFAPFVRSIFFQLSTVLLSCISWLLQFGFTYALDQKIGGATFFDNPSSRNICATSGWVQFLSVGFFPPTLPLLLAPSLSSSMSAAFMIFRSLSLSQALACALSLTLIVYEHHKCEEEPFRVSCFRSLADSYYV
eukprot:365121-Rhodomonas_salina.3